MNSHIKLPSKKFYIILISCAAIIFAASMETMMRVKDIGLYNQWLADLDSQMIVDNPYDIYVTANLSYYFLMVIIPMAYGLHSYFAYTKLRINGLFVFLWTVMVLGGLAYNVIEFNFYSVFYYAKILGYLVLLLTTLSLTADVSGSKLL